MDELRQQILDLLTRDHAHAGFDAAVKNMPPEIRGKRPRGAEHSPWEILEHLRLAQADMLDYIRNPKYVAREWPAGYWPKTQKPPDEAAWDKSVKAFKRDRNALAALVKDESRDLLAPIDYAGGKSLLRDILVVTDHNAYHIGQLIQLRRLLGAWPA